MHVVFAHQSPMDLPDFFTLQQHFPLGGVVGELFRLPVALLAHQFLLAPAPHRHSLLQVDVVFRQDDAPLARHDTHQVVELLLNRFQVIEDVRVIELKVVEDQRARAVVNKFRALIKEGAVVFVCFDDKKWAVAQAGRNLKIPRHATDHKAWLVAAGFQDPGRHSGGGGFAVRARNSNNPAIAQHKVMQPLRA